MALLLLLKAHVSGYTKRDGTVVRSHEDSRMAAQQPPKGALTLASGTIIPSAREVHAWRDGALNPKKIRERIAAKGRPWLGGSPGSLSPSDVDELVALMEASPDVVAGRKNAAETAASAAFARSPEAMAAAIKRMERDRRLEDQAKERARASVASALAGPGAALWRRDRRERVETLAQHSPELSLAEAISATLEGVARKATRWGWSLRHSSNSSGRADSRYLTIERPGGRRAEVRLSDHEIPVYGERESRYNANGGPRWGEIVLGRKHLSWTEADWERELRAAAGIDDGGGE